MSSFIIGNSEDAERLASVVGLTIRVLQNQTEELGNVNQRIHGAWHAPGEDLSLDETVHRLQCIIDGSVGDVHGLERALQDYADLLAGR